MIAGLSLGTVHILLWRNVEGGKPDAIDVPVTGIILKAILIHPI